MREEEIKLASKGKGNIGGAGRKNNIMTGRALFAYNPDLFQDDDNAGGADAYDEEQKETGKEEVKVAVDGKLFGADAGVDEEVDFD